MDSKNMECRFDEEVQAKMKEFEQDFLGNMYKKDTSENNGPNYRNGIAHEDSDAFGEYLESEFAEDFLNLK